MVRAKANEELELTREQHQRELEAAGRHAADELAKLQEALDVAHREVRVMKQTEGAVLAQAERERLKAFRMAEPLEAQIVMLREQSAVRASEMDRLKSSFEAEKKQLSNELVQLRHEMQESHQSREQADADAR